MPAPALAHAFIQRPDGWHELTAIDELRIARSPAEIPPLLDEIEHATAHGRHAVGFVSYEAAPAFDPHLAVQRADRPLACFVLGGALRPVPRCGTPGPLAAAWTPEWDAARHASAVAAVHAWIASGDSYQVNLTYRQHAHLSAADAGALLPLCLEQRHGHGLYLETPDFVVASTSPELFFERDGAHLVCRPMKGTAARGRWPEEDDRCRDHLERSAKDRAENLMIVDMVRNDLGRIARPGSVNVRELFTVERYPTVWQMTSTVEAETGAGLREIFAALFPSASVTGAPKVRTMQIIRDLESSPRGLYTGAAGWVGPDGRAAFNVAIRTVWLDKTSGLADYGTGSGVTWDSDAAHEYEECQAKTRVLAAASPRFDLLETIAWTPGKGYELLEGHLDRICGSAQYFEFPFDRAGMDQLLRDGAAGWSSPQRVRLLLSPSGACRIEHAPLAPPPAPPTRIGWAVEPVHTSDVLLYHKTTDRRVYEAARASRPDLDDVLLCNERAELTESTIANVAVKIDGAWCTPPISCGLLPGVMRRDLLISGRLKERVILRAELTRHSEIALFNSVRGWRSAEFIS